MTEIEPFRQRARAWLRDNVPRDERPAAGSGVREFDADWQRRQYEGGWAGIDWPSTYGGRGLSLLEQIVWYEEHVQAKAPSAGCFGVALAHAGPTLIMRGTEAQRAKYLRPILQGMTPWCQGFSEPGAGSDLAALRTRGVVDGEHLVITGHKVWTSHGLHADYGELLVRTDPAAARHKGISWVIMDMRLPGIEVRPIRQIDGRAEFCEVFYDEVRVPLSNVVGELGDGWSVAMSTLAAERGTGFLDQRLSEIVVVDDLLGLARERGLLRDDAFASRAAIIRAEVAALRSLAYLQDVVESGSTGRGAEASAMRAYYVQVQLRVAALAIDILGVEALTWNSWSRRWLTKFSSPIAGGTIDILKNIVAERMLGLPK